MITSWSKQNDASTALTSNFGYDAADQLISASVPLASGPTPQAYQYQYDLAGNRTTEQIDTNVTGSSYNNLNQLVSQAAGGDMVFNGKVTSNNNPVALTLAGQPATVDTSGNWRGAAPVTVGSNSIPLVATDANGKTTTKTITIVVSGGANRTLTYVNGNLTNDGNGKTYAYNALNKLISVTQTVNGVQTVTGFVYDGLGRRVQETANGAVVKQWVWRGGMQPCEERDADNNVTKRFYADGEQINGTNYYFTFDHLSSVREMTNSAGSLVARYDYDPYGRRTLVSGTDLADFGFTDFYYDQATGLWLSMSRPYAADLGRWLSRDPIGESGGLNLYDYVANDPIDGIDPLGLCRCDDLRTQLTFAEDVLNDQLANFQPGGAYDGLPDYVSPGDAFSEGDAAAALGAAGRAAYLDSARNIGTAGRYGTTIKTTSAISGKVGLGLGIAGTAFDVAKLTQSEDGSDFVSNLATVGLDGIGFIPGVGQVASVGQFVVSTGLLAYQTEANAEERQGLIQSRNQSQAVIQSAQQAIGRLTQALGNAGCNQ
jgi:RHS repeat-associated protein